MFRWHRAHPRLSISPLIAILYSSLYVQGKFYYYNKTTKQSVWKRPEARYTKGLVLRGFTRFDNTILIIFAHGSFLCDFTHC